MNKELKQKLKESGIDFYIEPKKKKNKNKPIEEIRSSVKLIYTPMGNKRWKQLKTTFYISKLNYVG